MSQQIKRISPHQTAKVFTILTSVGSLPFLMLGVTLTMFIPTLSGDASPMPFAMIGLFLFPVVYVVLGYPFVIIGCMFYNVMYQFFGGIELELEDT